METLIFAFLGGFVGNLFAYFIVLKTWQFPRIVIVPTEKLTEITKAIKEARKER